MAAVPAAAGALPAAAAAAQVQSPCPTGLHVLKARRAADTVLGPNPTEATIRSHLGQRKSALADQLQARYQRHLRTVMGYPPFWQPPNPNIRGDLGNGHRPLTNASAHIGLTIVWNAQQSPDFKDTIKVLLELVLSTSSHDGKNLLFQVSDVYTKEEVRIVNGRAQKRISATEDFVLISENASGTMNLLVEATQAKPFILHDSVMGKRYVQTSPTRARLSRTHEARKFHLVSLEDFLAAATYPALPVRNFMYTKGTCARFYRPVVASSFSVSAGVGGSGLHAAVSIGSIGSKVKGNWACYLNIIYAALFFHIPMAPLHPPSDRFRLSDGTTTPIANGRYFHVELKLGHGNASISPKNRNAMSGSSIYAEAVWAATYCPRLLERTETMQNFRATADGEAIGTLIAGYTSDFVARMSAFHELGAVGKFAVLARAGYHIFEPLQLQLQNTNGRALIRHGPGLSDDPALIGVDEYFGEVFHLTNPRYGIDLTLLTAEAVNSLQMKHNFRDFTTKLIDDIEEEKGEILFQVVPRAGASLLYKIDSLDIKVKLLSKIVADQITTWGEHAPV